MITRRRLLYGMAATPLAMQLTPWMLSSVAATASNPTSLENQNPGTLAWQLGLNGTSLADDTKLQIRGYASATSINKGDPITFYVTVNPAPQTYSIDVYRLGWYGGNGGQLKFHVAGQNGVTQPAPLYDSSTGLIACSWSASYTLLTSQATLDSTGWTSGIYVALLTSANKYQTYIMFVIRDDARTADLLFQQSVATHQAYNNFPDDGITGKSLYPFNSYGQPTTLGTPQAVKVSFDRPYSYTDHSGAGELLLWDIFFVRWVERNGYDICYSTDIDAHANGARLQSFKAVLPVGHGEYWSRAMYDSAYAARDAGTSLGFFMANPVYWQVRFEASTLNGVANRVVTCYKDATLDPVNVAGSSAYNPSLTTVNWRDPILNRPEQQLAGVMYSTYVSNLPPGSTYIVANSTTSSGGLVYGGTGLADGSTVPGIVGYEIDKQFSGVNTPVTSTDPASKTTVVPGTYTLLGNSPFTDVDNVSDHANSSIYQSTSGAWVFAAGSMDWNWGLDGYTPPAGIATYANPAPSAALQAATANILNLFLKPNLVPQTVPPPSSVVAALTGGGNGQKVNVSWKEQSTSVTSYVLDRSTDQITWTRLVSNLPPATTTYTDKTVARTTLYYYRVGAIVNSSPIYSSTVSVKTQ